MHGFCAATIVGVRRTLYDFSAVRYRNRRSKSICGEIENVDNEIEQLRLRIDVLRQRKLDLIAASGKSDVSLDPAQRDWIYDGYGKPRSKDYDE